MADTVYTVQEVALQDDSLVTLRPANIKVLRKGSEMLASLGETKTEEEGMHKLLDVVCMCLVKQRPEFEIETTVRGKSKTETNYDLMEDLFDMDTVFKVIEVYLGVKLNDPKLIEAAQAAIMASETKE